MHNHLIMSRGKGIFSLIPRYRFLEWGGISLEIYIYICTHNVTKKNRMGRTIASTKLDDFFFPSGCLSCIKTAFPNVLLLLRYLGSISDYSLQGKCEGGGEQRTPWERLWVWLGWEQMGRGLSSPCLRPGFGNPATFRWRISAKVKGCTAALSPSLRVSRDDQAELTYLQIQITSVVTRLLLVIMLLRNGSPFPLFKDSTTRYVCLREQPVVGNVCCNSSLVQRGGTGGTGGGQWIVTGSLLVGCRGYLPQRRK